MADPKHERALTAAVRSSRAKWRRVAHADNREPSTRHDVLAGDGCWCGEPFGHDWPGKADGAPHPRGAG